MAGSTGEARKGKCITKAKMESKHQKEVTWEPQKHAKVELGREEGDVTQERRPEL